MCRGEPLCQPQQCHRAGRLIPADSRGNRRKGTGREGLTTANPPNRIHADNHKQKIKNNITTLFFLKKKMF